MRLTRAQLAAAPLCGNCYDYIDVPDCKVVKRVRGWVHVGNNSVRCAGQEDDDTDDRAYPLRIAAGYVVGLSEDGSWLLASAETAPASTLVSGEQQPGAGV